MEHERSSSPQSQPSNAAPDGAPASPVVSPPASAAEATHSEIPAPGQQTPQGDTAVFPPPLTEQIRLIPDQLETASSTPNTPVPSTTQAPVPAEPTQPASALSTPPSAETPNASSSAETENQNPSVTPATPSTASEAPTPKLTPAASVPTPSPTPTAATLAIQSLLGKAREEIQERRRKKLERIIEFANARKKITNNDVQKLLRVSHATATRYLSQLVREGRLQRLGRARTAVYGPMP